MFPGQIMTIDRETLEGGMRLNKVRKIKQYLMIVQVVVVFAAVILLILAGGSIQLKPFYFNIGSILYFVILMALVMGVEGFIFRMLEIKYTRSNSSKYYMLKSSTRRSMVVIAVSAVVLVLLATPFMADVIANLTGETDRTADAVSFYSRDPLGLTSVDKIHIVSDTATEVIVISEANYLSYVGDDVKLRQHAVTLVVDASVGVDIAFPAVSFEKFYIVVLGTDTPITFTIHKILAPVFASFVSLFALLFIGAYAGWVIYTTPLRKQYSKNAIYR
jgi:hypothetical protein